ncbi:MAG: hypothetical protein CFE21_12200 [Bacteroidetes bacterium B1(2017)]|nr:MAG: hypothetical protein CFE21_12200 [Bacteroidetes bacterium B1(2017)]
MKKSFKQFKKADALFQAALLATSFTVLAGAMIAEAKVPNNFFIFYFVVGSAQLASFLINYSWAGNNQSKARKYYSYALIAFIVMLIPPLTFIGLMALLILSPITAIWYVQLSYSEFKEVSFFY